jgi:hypothetical protein
VLPDVEAAVTAMVRRWQRELSDVQQKYGFELVEDTMRWLEGQVDAAGGGPCAVADGRGLVGCSRELKEQDEVLGGGATGEVAIRLSTILARRKLSSVVARWCALVARGRATMAGSAQQRRIEQMSSRECRRWRKACMRRLARAWWAGTRRETVTVLVRRWECVVRERNKRRVAALAAMAVSAQTAIVRRVWLELVGRFWVDSRGGGGGGCEMEVEVERQKSGEGDGDSVVYDWSCTQCGWGGRLVEAGHSTCSKCEWQCLSWCEAAARIEMADDEMVGRMVQKRLMGRRVAAGVRRRMGEEMRRLQGDLVEQQSCGWRQRVQQTRRIGSGAAAGGRDGGFRLPKPRPKAVETGCESSQFLTIGSDPVDKTGRLPELAADGIEVEVAAAVVKAALVDLRTAVMSDMAVDSAGRVSWWLTWLEAAADVESVEAAEMSVGAEEFVPVEVYSRRAAEEYAEVGVLVEQAVSAVACRRAAELAVSEVWREGVDAAADEDSVWAVVLAGRAALQAARLSLREAREAVELGAAEEAAFLEAAARVRVPAKRKAAVELKAGLVSAEAWVVSAEAQVRADADASAAVMQMQMQVMQSRAEAAAGLRAVAVKQAAELRQEAQVEQAVKEAAMVVAAELEQSVELEFEQFDWHQAVAVGVVATEVHQAAELEVAAEEQAAEVKLAAEVEQAAEVRQAAEEAAVVEVEAEVEYAAEEAAVVEVGAVVEHAAEVEVAAEVEQAAEVEAGVWEAAILQSEAVMAEVMAADAVAAVANGEMVAAVEVAAMVKAEAANAEAAVEVAAAGAEAANAEAATEVAAAAEAVAVDVKAAAEVAVAEAEMKVATDLAATEVAAAKVAAAVDAVAAEAEAATVVAAADAEMQAAAELAAAAEAVAVDVEAAAELAVADGKMKATAEVAAAVDAVAADAEAAAEVAAEVTAMIQEAELYGYEMTVAEAVWRHEMLKQEAEQQESWLWEGSGDAASQHVMRCRSRKKKKKKKKR